MPDFASQIRSSIRVALAGDNKVSKDELKLIMDSADQIGTPADRPAVEKALAGQLFAFADKFEPDAKPTAMNYVLAHMGGNPQPLPPGPGPQPQPQPPAPQPVPVPQPPAPQPQPVPVPVPQPFPLPVGPLVAKGHATGKATPEGMEVDIGYDLKGLLVDRQKGIEEELKFKIGDEEFTVVVKLAGNVQVGAQANLGMKLIVGPDGVKLDVGGQGMAGATIGLKGTIELKNGKGETLASGTAGVNAYAGIAGGFYFRPQLKGLQLGFEAKAFYSAGFGVGFELSGTVSPAKIVETGLRMALRKVGVDIADAKSDMLDKALGFLQDKQVKRDGSWVVVGPDKNKEVEDALSQYVKTMPEAAVEKWDPSRLGEVLNRVRANRETVGNVLQASGSKASEIAKNIANDIWTTLGDGIEDVLSKLTDQLGEQVEKIIQELVARGVGRIKELLERAFSRTQKRPLRDMLQRALGR